MNSAVVHLTRGRSVARIATVIFIVSLGIALATAPEALAFGGGRFSGGGGGGYHPSGGGRSFGSDGFGGGNVSHANSYSHSSSHSYEFTISVFLPSIE
jgi:hypothetical protein